MSDNQRMTQSFPEWKNTFQIESTYSVLRIKSVHTETHYNKIIGNELAIFLLGGFYNFYT